RPKYELDWVNFHTFCHTYGTWMRRYGGLDVRGLVGTGRWDSMQSAERYAHVVANEEAMAARFLPTPANLKGVEKPWKTTKRSITSLFYWPENSLHTGEVIGSIPIAPPLK